MNPKIDKPNANSSRLIDDILARKKPKENGDSAPEQAQPQTKATTSSTQAQAGGGPAPTTTAEKEEERGRGKEFESKSGRKAERSVSPGTLPDGRHAKTDGDKGMGYVPPTKLGKLFGRR
ncbi:hypothetical protein DV735_g1499, partial [Chaetothyriales sp. CBS 134920]